MAGHRLSFVTRKKIWGEDRVTFQDAAGRLHSIPTSWTDLGPVDPFVVIAAGRAMYRPADLLAVVGLLERNSRYTGEPMRDVDHG